MNNEIEDVIKRSLKKKIKSLSTNPFISGWLSKATAFMVTPKMIVNALTFCCRETFDFF